MATAEDYVKLHVIIIIWGFTAILGALMTIPAIEVVLLRTALAGLVMGLILVLSPKEKFSVRHSDVVKLMSIGVIVAAHWFTFFAAARVANVSVSLVGLSTASLWTSVVEPITHGRKIKGFEVLLGCVVIIGLYIIFTFSFQYRLGLILGILAGFTSALFTVANSKMVKRLRPNVITFYEMTGAFVGTLLFIPLFKMYDTNTSLVVPGFMDWVYLFILSSVCTVYAYSVATELMRRFSVFFIQLSVNLEPIYGFILALLVFGEREKMQGHFYVGTAIILVAIISYPLLKKKFDAPILKS